MTPHGMTIIRDLFPMTRWAIDTNAKYQEAFSLLQPYEDSEIEAACRSLKKSISRSAIKADEIQCEARRLRRRSDIQAKVQRDEIDEAEVEREAQKMRNTLLLAPREDITKAVARCRKCAALDGTPLPADVAAWSKFQIGIVHAALEANMEAAR